MRVLERLDTVVITGRARVTRRKRKNLNKDQENLLKICTIEIESRVLLEQLLSGEMEGKEEFWLFQKNVSYTSLWLIEWNLFNKY